MANVGGQTLASEMNTFYTRLNAARKNHALATLSRNFSPNTPTQSSQMTALKSDLDNTASASKYIKTKTFDLKEIGIGDPTKYQNFTAVGTALDYIEAACVHDSSNYSHRSNDGDDSDRTHDAGDVNKGDIDRNHGCVD